MSFDYEVPLTSLARSMRERQTKAEMIFWNKVRNRRFLGYKFARQKPISSYIIDFYCHELLLAIELDGEIHQMQKSYDDFRSKELKALQITVIRYSNQQVLNELPRVLCHLKKIMRALASSPLGTRGAGGE